MIMIDSKASQLPEGYNLDSLPSPPFRKVADLNTQESTPVTHYINSRGEHYLFYRIEASLFYQRWLACRVGFDTLLQYLERKLTLRQILISPADGFLYCVETDSSQRHMHPRIVPLSLLPDYYLPNKKSFFEGNLVASSHDLTPLSAKLETGLMQVRFQSQARIGYGTIYLSVLAPALVFLHEITSHLGLGYYRRWQETTTVHFTDKALKMAHKSNMLSAARFELIGVEPGSYNVVLRPLNQQLTLPGQESEADKYNEYLMSFIAASFDFAELRNFVNRVDSKVVSNYQSLLKLIRTYKLQLTLHWTNANSRTDREQTISFREALHILDNITQLEYLNNDDLSLTGRFMALNVKNNTYAFESNDPADPNSRGFIASALHGGVPMISFNKEYDVVVQRIEMKQAGLTKPKIKDLLISFMETDSDR
jgi:hypothetical protein